MTPDTLRELAPELPAAAIREMYSFGNFEAFLQTFAGVVKRLRSPEDYALVARRLLGSLEEQNVACAEIIVSAGVVLWKQQEFAPVFDALRSACLGSRVKVAWILDAVRQFGVEHAMQVAELAVERAGQGVVAFGIGGSEERGPASWFGEVFRFARKGGLRLTAHAGETAGPDSIWAALEIGAERIGHGIRAVEDPVLLRHLRDRNIPLEVCITSNIATGAVASYDAHPVRLLYDAGVPITLNTDDPGIFGTTLVDEYRLAAERYGFTEDELTRLAANSLRYAFCP